METVVGIAFASGKFHKINYEVMICLTSKVKVKKRVRYFSSKDIRYGDR